MKLYRLSCNLTCGSIEHPMRKQGQHHAYPSPYIVDVRAVPKSAHGT
ncbi:hypothetical protein THF1C08_90132 [Vibrio jasicida]|nr:hypothetical protein THF1C08_90132 [Vibrio jasicida]